MKSNRRSTKKSATLLLAILISISVVGTATAGWVPVTGDFVTVSSIPEGGLEVGDKLFSEFEVKPGVVSGGPLEPTADTLLVQGGFHDLDGDEEHDPDEDYGLGFRLAWNAGSNQLINTALNFKVSIRPDYDPYFITDATLWLATASAAGTGLVQATENIYDADFMGKSLAVLSASAQDNDYGAFLMDSSLLCLVEEPVQVKEIWVRMGVTVQGGDTGSAGLHEMFMLYSQIPEPTTILLLGLGALALVRKRRQ